MPQRKRFISPEFFQHAELYDAEFATAMPLRLAYAGLWTVADRRGLFWWRPRELKLAILPYDLLDFDAVLSALEEFGFIERYLVDGKPIGRIPAFSRWQTFHKNEKPSDIPEPAIGRREPSKFGAETSKFGIEPSPSIAVSTAVTATVAVTAAVARDEAVQESNGEHRTLLATAANQGIAEQFGEQPAPLRWDHKGTFALAAKLEAAAVPLGFAQAKVFELARTRVPSDGQPPRTLSYYAAAVIDAWRAEEAHRVAAVIPRPVSPGAEVIDFERIDAVSLARQGSVEAQQLCDERGWPWREVA